MANEDKLTTPSVLAFGRKLDTSDGLFYAGRWDNRGDDAKWAAVALRAKSVRGTISNRLKGGDTNPAKLDADIQSPNPQTVDVANLPNDMDTLRLRFTLKVLPGAGTPSACDSAPYQKKLKEIIDGYGKRPGFGELAKRYAYNLANGRFLWRNRLGAEEIAVIVRLLEHGAEAHKWEFDALSYSTRGFDKGDQEKVGLLAEAIEQGLAGDRFVLLEVVAYARMGDGQEVFPSQELILDRSNAKGGKSKTLYCVGEVAAMHSQKLGNALRTIDTWYPDAASERLGPIAVEPYGSVTSQGKAYRQPKQKLDFYNLLDDWMLKDKEPALEQQHFVMATLIRGGVFGEKKE